MYHFLRSLSHAPLWTQVVIFCAVLITCWLIENIAGWFSDYNKWRHAFLNAGFVFTNLPVQFFWGLAFTIVMRWTTLHHFGLLHRLGIHEHPVFFFCLTFLILDLGEYIYHVLVHKVKRLWMFHVVHHSDTMVDVSTTLREHPGENIIRNGFTILWVFLSGAVFWTLLLRQLIQMISNLFAHVHYRLPDKVDRVAGWVFITPNLHHVHHHYQQPYTDCNYGDVLSIWDRLFGTFKQLSSEKTVLRC